MTRTIFEGRGQREAAEAVEEARTTTREKKRSNGVTVDGGVELFDFIFRFLLAAVAAARGGDIVREQQQHEGPLSRATRDLCERLRRARAPYKGAQEEICFLTKMFFRFSLSLFLIFNLLIPSLPPRDGLALGSGSHSSIFKLIFFIAERQAKQQQQQRSSSKLSSTFNHLLARGPAAPFPLCRRARRLLACSLRLALPAQARQAPETRNRLGPRGVRAVAQVGDLGRLPGPLRGTRGEESSGDAAGAEGARLALN